MKKPKYPSLYQINTRVWLTELSRDLGRHATLDDIPDLALDQIATAGFDWVWLLSVWTTGQIGRKVSCENAKWRLEFEITLPDLCEEDIGGSGFAICNYKVHPDFGGDEALKRLRERLANRGLKLMLDFVPNHMGPDCTWIEEYPEYFVSGTASDLAKNLQNYKLVKSNPVELILAYGRDPYFDGWPDTVQLDYSNPATVAAMTEELLRISRQCDGVRCDMAMLILPDIFERTWGRKAQTFWPVIINSVREKVPDFCFMAEVYWDMEWTLQQQGFNYTYDKKLYDRLIEADPKAIREHFYASLDYQEKLARFLENHDELRAAATFEQKKHEAAAVITFLSPGLRFFYQGQFEGRKKRISPHLVRAPQEPINAELQKFYTALMAVIRMPVLRDGNWQLLECKPAWESNGSWDSFITYYWRGSADERIVIAVNYSAHQSQCYVKLPFPDLAAAKWRLQDLMSEAVYDRDGKDLQSGGLYLDMLAWQFHVFELKKTES